MRTLKVNEAVHCKTAEQFITVDNILSRQFGKTLGIEVYGYGKDDTILSYHKELGYGYDGIAWHKDHDFKIYSFEEFMGIKLWKHVVGEKYWYLILERKIYIGYTTFVNDKWDKACIRNGNYFKTRKLARIAKANLLKCINEQEHE